jgi:hypothetical protein
MTICGTSPYGAPLSKSDILVFMTIPQPVGRPELSILLRINSVLALAWDAHYPFANTGFVLGRTPAHAPGLANGSFEL